MGVKNISMNNNVTTSIQHVIGPIQQMLVPPKKVAPSFPQKKAGGETVRLCHPGDSGPGRSRNENGLLKQPWCPCPWRIRMYAILMVCHLPSTKTPVMLSHIYLPYIHGSVMGWYVVKNTIDDYYAAISCLFFFRGMRAVSSLGWHLCDHPFGLPSG